MILKNVNNFYINTSKCNTKVEEINKMDYKIVDDIDLYNKELVNKIFDDVKNYTSLSCYAFVDIINEVKSIFLYKENNMPTPIYMKFIMFLLTNIEIFSFEQLKIIERFCLRMDEDAVTGIIKYYNTDCKNNNKNGYITCMDLFHLLKKYETDNNLIFEIIKKDHVNISNSLVNILAKNIRTKKQFCKYNNKCYRKNKEHLKTYFHI